MLKITVFIILTPCRSTTFWINSGFVCFLDQQWFAFVRLCEDCVTFNLVIVSNVCDICDIVADISSEMVSESLLS